MNTQRYRTSHLPRISRRGLLSGAALSTAAMAVMTLVGCGSSQKKPAAGGGAASNRPPTVAPASPVAKQPRAGGVIVHSGGNVGAYDSQGNAFDPDTMSALSASTFRHVYQGLLGYDTSTYEVRPELAQKWEQPDQNTYLFTLQPNVKFHNKPPANGRAMTVDDLVYSLHRANTNDPKFVSRSLLAGIDQIEAVDQRSLRVTTSSPNAATLSNLSGDNLMVLAREVVEKSGAITTAEAVVGTGAFIMKSAAEKVGGEYIRNPDYWKPGLPYLDGIRTPFFSDIGTAWAAFQAGKLDVTQVSGTEAKGYIAQQGKDFVPAWDKDPGVLMLNPNTKAKPLDDLRVARATRLLIDHQEFINTWIAQWFGKGRHGSILPTALDTWDLTEAEYEQHLEWKRPKDDAVKEALALLSAAGFTKDNPLRFEFANQGSPGGTFNEAFAVLVISQWRRLGQDVIDAQDKAYDAVTSNTVRANRSYAYFGGGNQGSSVEPDAWLTQIYRSGASRNYANFSDAKLDALIDKQRTIFDVPQRKAAVKEIVLYMIDQAPTTIPANRNFLTATAPKVHNFSPEFYMRGSQYEHVWLEA